MSLYNKINEQIVERIGEETDLVANLANVASIIKLNLENVGWVGFFLEKEGELVLGPFQGKPATSRIQFGKGVCGKTAESQEVQLVIDVRDFPGHLACDASSNSEVCLPIIVDDKVVGVLDMDSHLVGRFDTNDVNGLNMILDTLKSKISFV